MNEGLEIEKTPIHWSLKSDRITIISKLNPVGLSFSYCESFDQKKAVTAQELRGNIPILILQGYWDTKKLNGAKPSVIWQLEEGTKVLQDLTKKVKKKRSWGF